MPNAYHRWNDTITQSTLTLHESIFYYLNSALDLSYFKLNLFCIN